MCKVMQYHFTCGHYLKLCKSRCGGTKEKKTRTSVKAACCSEAYIHITLPFGCSKCHQDTWLACWKGKLERAIAFRNGLQDRGLPGGEEIARLVKELEEEYASAAWDLNKTFPPAHNKTDVKRVKLATKEDKKQRRPASLLKREVQPHEVVLPEEKQKGWIENDEDNEDYVCSTDPFHPVSTDYAHPLENTDDSWLLEHFTAEELQSPPTNEFRIDDSLDNDWDWGGTVNTTEKTEEAVSEWNSRYTAGASSATGLTAWGPDADANSSAAEISMNGLRTEEEKQKTVIKEVIKSFWEVVNTDSSSKAPLVSFLQGLSLDMPSSNDLDSSIHADPTNSNLNTQHDPGYLWTDGPSDLPARLLPRRPSTHAKYDKMRTAIQKLKLTDPRLYYAKWLLLSRMEIRQFVGPPESWTILDPK